MSTTPSRIAVKRTLIGRPRATEEMEGTLLSKTLALPVFASDPLSSVAYATESGLVVLVAASATAADTIMPITIAIAVLLAIVIVSYRQTVLAYQTSGGAYVAGMPFGRGRALHGVIDDVELGIRMAVARDAVQYLLAFLTAGHQVLLLEQAQLRGEGALAQAQDFLQFAHG